jgi:dihydroxyacetone synthase
MTPSATLLEFDPVKSKLSNHSLGGHEDHDLVLRTFRVLVVDLVQQFNGGHPGYAPQLRELPR